MSVAPATSAVVAGQAGAEPAVALRDVRFAYRAGVDVLRVEHVLITGHYGCGGVRASLDDRRYGLIDNWLRHVQDVAQQHDAELAMLAGDARVDRLCELNVAEQVLNTARSTVVQDAWERGQTLTVHAWIYRLDDGIIRDLGFDIESAAELSTAI